MNQLFTVTLTDLGTYQVTVAAGTPSEAVMIGKAILWDEATSTPPGLTLKHRETDGAAEPAAALPIRQFRVGASYRLDFAMTVPAHSREEAERHARRLYDVNCGPFEFDHCGDRVGSFVAEEVVS